MRNATFASTSIRCLAVSVSVLMGLAGCSSGDKHYEGGMKTGSNLHEIAAKMEVARKQMDTSLAQADALVNQPAADPRKQFDQYRKSLESLEKTTKDITELADDMRSRKDAYFAQWEKDVAKIKNEDIRQVSAQRRNERMAQFDELRASAQEVRDTFQPFMQDLQSIRQALSVELNAGSLASMKPFVAKARTDAVPLEKAMNDLRAQFQELGVQMSPVSKS